MPKVSVIIPNYNHAPFLERRIESVIGQTLTDFELLLLDDCSTDDSVSILNRYRGHPKVKEVIASEANSGSTFLQWQRGLERAEGEYIWIAESDDLAAPELLARLVGLLDANPRVGLAYCQSARIDATGTVTGSWRSATEALSGNPWRADFVAEGRALIRRYFMAANYIPNASAVVFRRSHIGQQTMSEAASFKLNGDWFIWCNIMLAADVAFISAELNFHRMHSAQGSPLNIRNFNNIAELYRLRGFLYDALDLPDADRRGLNLSLFHQWMAQRRSMGLSKTAPETLNVLAAAEAVDPLVRERLTATV